jgi:hypothetical protein
MAFRLSKLSRDRLQGVHPDPVRVAERAIQITTQVFRVQEGLRTRERQAELVAGGASRTMNSRHLTGHAVDLVALDGGGSAGSRRTTFGSPPRCRRRRMSSRCRCAGAAVGTRSWRSRPPKTASPTTSRPAGHAAAGRSSTARTSGCQGPAGVIDWIKTTQGVAAIVAGIFATNPARRPEPPRASLCRLCRRPLRRRFAYGWPSPPRRRAPRRRPRRRWRT